MWWDPNNLNGFWPLWPIVSQDNDRNRVKEGNEFYQVYVNQDYVGDKECVAQGDGGPSSVEDYLKSRGFGDLAIQTEGNQIRIQADEADQAEEIKINLSVYLSIR